MSSSVTRRSFLVSAGAITASAYAVTSLPAWASAGELKGSVVITPALATFPYSDVQLLDGPMKRQFDENHARFVHLDDDRLVKVFRETLDAKAKFFVDYRLPAYTYDKLACGLIDAHEYAHDPLAMQIHEKLTHAITAYLPEKALSRQEQRSRPHKDTAYTWDETYTLPENLFLAYQRTGNVFYREMAKKYLEDDTYFNPLSQGNDVLPFEHAYSHVNAFSSAMQAYITLGSEKHLRAAKNGFEMLQTTQSFATGGWGPNESFGEPGIGQLGNSLSETHASFETPCGAYGHFKITRYLLRVTKDSKYGDSMERVLYNTILGAWPIQADGTS